MGCSNKQVNYVLFPWEQWRHTVHVRLSVNVWLVNNITSLLFFCCFRETIVSQSTRDTIVCSVTLPLLFSCCTGYLPAVHSVAAITMWQYIRKIMWKRHYFYFQSEDCCHRDSQPRQARRHCGRRHNVQSLRDGSGICERTMATCNGGLGQSPQRCSGAEPLVGVMAESLLSSFIQNIVKS